MMGVKDAFIFALSPPPIPELGNATGFNFRLQDRGGNGHEALVAARNQLLGMAAQSKLLAGVRPDGLEDAPQLRIDIDRDKAGALGVGFDAINNVISTAFGSSYVNDFQSQGRLQRVVVQVDAADAHAGRRHPAAATPSTTAASWCRCRPLPATRWISGPMQLIRYNGYPTMRIAGDAAPGVSTGEAMAEMERLAGAAAAGLRLRMDRPVARGTPGRRAPRCTCSASRCWRCSCAWRRCTRAGRSPSRCCWWCRWACSAWCSARRRAASATTCTSRSA